MEQTKESLLAALPSVAKGPKLRRKLQKSLSKHRSTVPWRLGSGASTATRTSNKSETTNINKPGTQTQDHAPSLPPPDLSDSKWAEFFPGDRRIQLRESPWDSQEGLRRPGDIVPEFSHLVRSNPHQRSSSNPESPAPSAPKMRRRAKTPIFSIGQLEDIPRPSNALGRTSSVDLIADQYRALLDYRASVHSDAISEPSLSLDEGESDEALIDRRRRSSASLPPETPICAPMRNRDFAQRSTTSDDDGTLVAFEEETVYFKPVSFSPEPTLPLARFPSYSSCTSADDNLSLQICLDLLTRDLSSALEGRPGKSCPDPSALQVWVMIEAYERLRDQILERRPASKESRSLEMMFDMWLRSLYAIHDSLTGNGARSESDYGAELGTEELD